MLRLLRQPSIMRLGTWHSLALSSAIGLFVFVFLYIFEPLGLSDVGTTQRKLLVVGYATVTFFVLLGNLTVVPSAFPGVFNEDRWNLGKKILWQMWLVFSVGTGCFLVNALYHLSHGHWSLSLEHYLRFQLYTSVTGLFPIVVLNLIMHILWLKRHLRQSQEISARLLSNSTRPDKRTDGVTAVVLTAESGKEEYEINAGDILYASSEGNYTNLFVMTNDVKKLTIRGSLTHITRQLEDFPFLLRCHRAFLVNIRKVRRVGGNAQGLQLFLDHVDQVIPVARGHVREFRTGLRACGYHPD